jgi:glycosyltransferase involved in cell wall biosynthesis
MKLVIATPLYPPEIGGPATYAKLLFEGLPERGIEVELVKFSEVRRLPKLIRHYVYYRRVLRAARSADAVLALDPVSVGLPACIAAWRTGKPFVVKVVGDYAWEQGRQRFGVTQSLDAFVKTEHVPFPVWLLRRVQAGVASRARRVIVPSEYLKNIVAAWGIEKENIRVIYNAVALQEVGTAPDAIATLPGPLVITAGRLVQWKHIGGIIDAVADIPQASLAIVGDGPLRTELSRHARAKLGDRAAFTGLLPHADTLVAIRSAGVFVLNSSYEGLSHLLIEALMLGVPIVATHVGGNPEVITDGEDGLLIPVGDTPALASAIKRILTNDDLRARLSKAAAESAERFTMSKMLARTSELLTRL